MKSVVTKGLGAALLIGASTPALAHTGGIVGGLSSGIAHPLLGLDHLLAMVAVGIFAAVQPQRSAWQAPVAFVVFLAAGALFGGAGIALPFVEPGILASVVLLGLMIAFARVLPAAAGLAAIGVFGLLHGHAHGVEAAGAFSAYMAGFLAASATLHLAGYGMGRALGMTRNGLAASGLAVMTAGLVLAGG